MSAVFIVSQSYGAGEKELIAALRSEVAAKALVEKIREIYPLAHAEYLSSREKVTPDQYDTMSDNEFDSLVDRDVALDEDVARRRGLPKGVSIGERLDDTSFEIEAIEYLDVDEVRAWT